MGMKQGFAAFALGLTALLSGCGGDDEEKKSEATCDFDAQTDLLEAAEAGIWADAVTIPIFQFPGLTVNSDKVTEVKAMPLSPDYFWNFWEWTPANASAE